MNTPGTPGALGNPGAPATFDETLQEIERLLGDEYDALRSMNGSAIAEAAEKKTALEARLRGFQGRVTDAPPVRAALERVRKAAQRNHALLIHARACIKSTLDIATGRPRTEVTYRQMPTPSNAPVAPMRVNIKG